MNHSTLKRKLNATQPNLQPTLDFQLELHTDDDLFNFPCREIFARMLHGSRFSITGARTAGALLALYSTTLECMSYGAVKGLKGGRSQLLRAQKIYCVVENSLNSLVVQRDVVMRVQVRTGEELKTQH